jgi:hypothetical protein
VVQQAAPPQTLGEAMASVAAYTAQRERYNRLLRGQPAPEPADTRGGRIEEPMEVNAVTRAVESLRHMEEPEGAAGGSIPTEQAIARLSLQMEDIAMIARQPATTVPGRDQANQMEQMLAAIVKLTNQMGGMSKEMAKLKGQTIHVPAPPPKPLGTTNPGRSNNQGEWTADRQPICYECKEIGHMGRDCPVRARRLSNLRSGNGNAPQ